MQWYYSKNGTQLGPVSQSDLQSKISTGEISASDLVWKEGLADWLPAAQVAELKPVVVPSSPSFGDSGQSTPYTAPSAPAYNPAAVAPGQVIPNYLWQSIVVTIFCCWPLGIPAIVFAAKVDGLRARGDIPGALAASANAKKWTWIAFGCGLAVIIIYLVVAVVAGVSGANVH